MGVRFHRTRYGAVLSALNSSSKVMTPSLKRQHLLRMTKLGHESLEPRVALTANGVGHHNESLISAVQPVVSAEVAQSPSQARPNPPTHLEKGARSHVVCPSLGIYPSNQQSISWSAPKDFSGVTYTIQIAASSTGDGHGVPTGQWQTIATNVKGTSASVAWQQVKGINNGFVRVIAVGKNGLSSEPSAPISYSVSPPPPYQGPPGVIPVAGGRSVVG